MEVDYYAILQLEPDATPEAVHRAYRALAMRYHPDRNTAADAATAMARINEAYAVLSEPARRRRYDQGQRLSCKNDLALPIVAAARDAILRQRWTVLRDDGASLLLEQSARRVHIYFMDRLTIEKLRKLTRQCTDFAVVLTVEVEHPINLAFHIAVIDLLHSSHCGAPFPDPGYRALFEPFLRS
jgi:curved DNA-binding protein CbpA